MHNGVSPMVLLFIEKLEEYFGSVRVNAIKLPMRFVGVELPTELTSHYSSILSPSTIASGLKVYARVHIIP